MDYRKVKNTRALEIKFLPPTNYKGARVKVTDKYRNESAILSYCYRTGDILEQAYNLLIKSGFSVVARASSPNYYILCIDNWGENFKSVKELKKQK